MNNKGVKKCKRCNKINVYDQRTICDVCRAKDTEKFRQILMDIRRKMEKIKKEKGK